MAVMTISTPPAGSEDFDIESATTLQELLDAAAEFLSSFAIDHAVLLSIPSSAHALNLPLLPITNELKSIIRRAIDANVHPAAVVCQQTRSPCSLADLSTEELKEPLVEQLLIAFREAGMRQVYELPLVTTQGQRFILEIARIGQGISDCELSEIQTIAAAIPRKLPSIMAVHPAQPDNRQDYAVR